jgi:hypothetical protein
MTADEQDAYFAEGLDPDEVSRVHGNLKSIAAVSG